MTAVLTSLSGSLTQNAAPLQWLTSQSGSLPESTTATLADLPGGGTTGTGSGDGRRRRRRGDRIRAAPSRPTSGSAASWAA